jgi:hypothetical protein
MGSPYFDTSTLVYHTQVIQRFIHDKVCNRTGTQIPGRASLLPCRLHITGPPREGGGDSLFPAPSCNANFRGGTCLCYHLPWAPIFRWVGLHITDNPVQCRHLAIHTRPTLVDVLVNGAGIAY